MHDTFVFPIDCFSSQIALNKPEVIKTELGLFIYDEEIAVNKSYKVFDTIEIIPSLIAMVDKLKKNGEEWKREDTENVGIIVNWMKKWGFLKPKEEHLTLNLNENKSKKIYGEYVFSILDESRKFYDLWRLYRAVVNKDITVLQSIITVTENPDCMFEDTHIFYFFENEYCDYTNHTTSNFDEKQPLKSYQWAAMEFLVESIHVYINQNSLNWAQMRQIAIGDKDRFELKPAMYFDYLIDALYMQFFILLTENTKKICPVCNHPFIPERKDRKYCSDSCKHTAKSQRYRDRKRRLIHT